MKRMVERFGYFLGETELGRLRYDLPSGVPQGTTADTILNERPPWVRLPTDIFDNHWRFFQGRCKKLTAELNALTGLKAD